MSSTRGCRRGRTGSGCCADGPRRPLEPCRTRCCATSSPPGSASPRATPRRRPRALRGGVGRGLRRVRAHGRRTPWSSRVARVRGRPTPASSAPRPAGAAGRGERPARALPRAPGRVAPVVVLLEDLHWADDASLTWLDAADTGAGAAPVLVVARRGRRCWRPSALGRGPASSRRIALEPLSRRQSRLLLEQILQRVQEVPPCWSTWWSTAPRATRSTSRSSSPGSSTPVSLSAATVRGTCGWTASTRSACRPRSRVCCRPASTPSRGPNALCCNARR